MAFVELKNNDGTPYKSPFEDAPTTRAEQLAVMSQRSEADVFLERTLKGDISGTTVVLALASIVALMALWQVLRSPTEGARRFRVVLLIAGAIALVIAFINGNSEERTFLAVAAGAFGAAAWIFKGSKQD